MLGHFHDDDYALQSREREDHWFGAPEQSDTYPNPLTEEEEAEGKLELPATMDEHVERQHGTDEDPEGRFQ